MLSPIADSDIASAMLQWIEKQHSNDRIVIGINAKNPKLTAIYVNTLIELYSENKNFSFMLIPHDFRDYKGISDVVLADAVLQQVPSEIKPYCIRIPTPFKAAEIKGIVAHLDLVLSGRMHLAIACLGQGTPVVCITYQGKFEGLLVKHFELEGMTIDPEDAMQLGSLAKFLMPIIEKREDIRQHIQSKLPKIQHLSQANFR